MKTASTHAGDTWELSGRLYDFDTVDRDGLVGFELLVQLDGTTLFTTTTGADGAWSATVPATMDLTRGQHTISVVFEGTQAHLPAEAENSVRVWADLIIQVDPATRSSVVTRSDGVFEPVFYSGSIQEVGGSGEVLRTSSFPSATVRIARAVVRGSLFRYEHGRLVQREFLAGSHGPLLA